MRMPKRTKKQPTDFNVLAAEIVDSATSPPGYSTATIPKPPKKNPAAVALGRLGGLKGGKARAEKLSAKTRKAIARKAAKVRWAAESGKE